MAITDLADLIRRHVTDPTNELYKDRPDLRQKAELDIRAAELRSGETITPETPERLAARQHDAAFSMRELHPGLAEMLGARTAALAEANTPKQLAELAEGLREKLGADAFGMMVENARHALAGEVPKSVLADLPTLRVFAAQGRYLRLHQEPRA